jgi:hypothetical protein
MAARSVSLPDFQNQGNSVASAGSCANANSPSSAAATTPEEEKRRKRLARNRASARLRRLRKKNLVESYEGEVTVLEQALSKLRQHEWGGGDSNNTISEATDDGIEDSDTKEAGSKITSPAPAKGDHTALLEALSMERGQQALDQTARRELIKSILEQQREQVANLQEAHLEGRMLGWLVRQSASLDGNEKDAFMAEAAPVTSQGETPIASSAAEGKIKLEEENKLDEEELEIAKELQEILNLSPEQEDQLRQVSFRNMESCCFFGSFLLLPRSVLARILISG